jgi:hypothetical protein
MSTCECSATPTMVCRHTPGERPRFFARQLVTAEDLTLEQEYFRNRMRLHNRLLHGWGAVCGLLVSPVAASEGGSIEAWKVRVCPGYAIGPSGDDIFVPCEVEIDLRQDSISGSSVEPCGVTGDVWCSDVWLDRSQDQVLYLAIRYNEVPARPVRVQPAGCSCDDTACEHSRFRDGYVVKVMTAAEYRPIALDTSRQPNWRELFPTGTSRDPNPSCLPCPDKPWVVLASVMVNSDGKITVIDNNGPRRLVAALGSFYWTSAGQVKIEQITRKSGETSRCGSNAPLDMPRNQTETFTVSGGGFEDGLTVNFGPGVTVSPITKNANWPKSFNVNVTVQEEATAGTRDLIVMNPDCSSAICLGVLSIAPLPLTLAGAAPAAAITETDEKKVTKRPSRKKR